MASKSKPKTRKPKKEALLDDEGDFKEKTLAALKEVFKRFDEDSDDVLNDKELDSFATACNGSKFSKETKEEIADNFTVNEKGDLTLKGFLEMYHTQTMAEEDETWRDLQKLGYNNLLELIKEEEKEKQAIS